MRLISVFVLCAALALVSCGGNTTSTNTKTTVKANVLPVHSRLSGPGTRQIMNVLMQYYALKNALVASKAGRADSAALLLSSAGDSLRKSIFSDSALAATSKTDLDTIISYSRALAAITDASCERQRLLFGNISSAFYALLKNADLKNAGIYREYCPMAYNEKGAYWLSEETEIKNPYFGKKMLECGEVTDSLK